MNGFKNINIVLIFTLLCGFLSCRSDNDEPVIMSDEVELNVGFRIGTRASGDGYEVGETYENYIDIAAGDYRIYFFDGEDRFIARFRPNAFLVTEGSNYTEYNVLGAVSGSLVENETFKIVVIANWDTYMDDDMIVGKTTIDDLCRDENSQFSQFEKHELGENQLIPFFGVREYENVKFTSNEITILSDPVTLIRSVAKVEVVLKSETGNGLSFGSVEIHRYNSKGYCAPLANERGDYDHDGVWADDYAGELHLVNDRNDPDDKSLPFRLASSWEEDGYKYEKWIAYLTEYRNKGQNDRYCSIKTKFTNQLSDDITHTIYFSAYENGRTDNSDEYRLDVERNNIYRFNVVATPLKILVSVDEWQYGGKVSIEM